MKPRLYLARGEWRCISLRESGLRILGIGDTPQEAYRAWALKNKCGFYK